MVADPLIDPFDRRIERARTWIKRAVDEPNDLDTQVIFYWVAFNALYGAEPVAPVTEANKATKQFDAFFQKIANCDSDLRLQKEIWGPLVEPICRLMRNKYVFSPFWKFHYGKIRRASIWKKHLDESNRTFWGAWHKQNVRLVLSGVFERLYVLRNQLMHGGARWNSALNRSQVRQGTEILSALVPAFLKVMDGCSRRDWGQLAFPPIDDPLEFDDDECMSPQFP